MPRPSLVASSGPSPVRGFIAAIERSFRMLRSAHAERLWAETAHPATALGSELSLAIVPYPGPAVCKDPT
ncbi:hypothetical protein TUM20985_13620 [Mycobacterium antarcticum]|nr:hypothetical protein TUM20985_13620 [Mycolicibacterium sp. TUM20985]GLP74180.1 hypothetical protein TUM20983_12900 [Mycolicibacterium sp. TUM20983]